MEKKIVYGRKNPFLAKVKDHVLLSGTGSGKEIWHIEIDLKGSGMEYLAGDSLSVVPKNADDVVDLILELTGFDKNHKIALSDRDGGGEHDFRKLLLEHYDITKLSNLFIKKYSEMNGDDLSGDWARVLTDKNFANEYLWGKQLSDFLRSYPPKKIEIDDFVKLLKKIQNRLYSIASSLRVKKEQVDLTVGAVRYEESGTERKGVCSTYLADMLEKGSSVECFVQANRAFRLPEDVKTPIIMVGPGTGIAPFRSFVQERSKDEDRGDSWLFFGDQCYMYDFLYQIEWQKYLKTGVLTRLDLAFSRDQEEKIYVQDRMRENGAEIFDYINKKGAHFYVCGDASRMAKDVHNELIAIVAKYGEMGLEDATKYVKTMQKEKRYQRDVY